MPAEPAPSSGRPAARPLVPVAGGPSAPGGEPKPARVANQSSLREHNISLVLTTILEAPKPLTRARIAKVLGLARATVSDLVDLLIDGRFVTELHPVTGSGAGRPGVPLTPTRGEILAVGLEVQVDRIGFQVVDLAGRVLAEKGVAGDFRGSDPAKAIRALTTLAAPTLAGLQSSGVVLSGAGVSVPGLTRRGTGELRFAPNLGWVDVDVFALIRDHPPWRGLPLFLGNDADLGARAEAYARARARGTPNQGQSFLYLAGGVGVGGAVVVEGSVTTGQHGWSGEIGHTVVDPQGPVCSCGASGCLEQYAGRDALFLAAGLDSDLGVDRLVAALQARQPGALAAMDVAARSMGVAISNALNLIDVDRVVLGGMYEPLYRHLRRGVEDQLFRRVLAARWTPLLVEPAQAGMHASLTGAALLALDALVANPSPWVSVGA